MGEGEAVITVDMKLDVSTKHSNRERSVFVRDSSTSWLQNRAISDRYRTNAYELFGWVLCSLKD